MERHLITLLICVCVSVLHVWTLKYTSSWNGAPLGENTPRFILYNKSLKECLYECVLRPWCKVVGYHKYGFCEILFDSIPADEQQCSKADCNSKATGMMFVERKNIESQDRDKCDEKCSTESVPTGLLKTCEIKGASITCVTDACPPLNTTVPNGKFLGNTHEIGHNRRLLCNHGSRPLDLNNVTSECKGGRWTNVTTCVQDCVAYPSPEHGAVSGTLTIGGSTRELTCKSGYSPADANNVTSTCTNGQWTSITKCLKDCPAYPSPENGAVSGTSAVEGSTRELTCQSGSTPADASNVTSTCTNGEWTAITKCLKECVLNQRTYGGSTYTFAIRSRRSYNDSVAFCQHCGYRVVTIESEDEHTFVTETMSRFLPSPTNDNDWSGCDGFFIDFYETGGRTFRMDNDSLVLFTKFSLGEPNYEEEKFIAAVGVRNWQWSDVYPYMKMQTVCENEN